MTTSRLLLYIVLGILTQVICALCVYLWRKRRGGVGAPNVESGASRPQENATAWLAFRVTRKEFEDPAQTQCSFYLEPVDRNPLPDYRPGQYLTFSVPATDSRGANSDRTITRCYSLSDAAHPTHYRVTIKRASPPEDQPTVPPGLSSNYFMITCTSEASSGSNPLRDAST